MAHGLGNENEDILDSNQSKMDAALKRNGLVAPLPTIDIPADASIDDHCALADVIVAETASMDTMLKALEEEMKNVHRQLEAPDDEDKGKDEENNNNGSDDDDDDENSADDATLKKRGKKGKLKTSKLKKKKKKKTRQKDQGSDSSDEKTKTKGGKGKAIRGATKKKKKKQSNQGNEEPDAEESVAPTPPTENVKGMTNKPADEEHDCAAEATKIKGEIKPLATPSLFMMAPPTEEQTKNPKKKMLGKSKFGSFSDDDGDDSGTEDHGAMSRKGKNAKQKAKYRKKEKTKKPETDDSDDDDELRPDAEDEQADAGESGYNQRALDDKNLMNQPDTEKLVTDQGVAEKSITQQLNNYVLLASQQFDKETEPIQKPLQTVPDDAAVDQSVADPPVGDQPANDGSTSNEPYSEQCDFDAAQRTQAEKKQKMLDHQNSLAKPKKRRPPKRCRTMPLPPRSGEERFDWANFRKTQKAADNYSNLGNSEPRKSRAPVFCNDGPVTALDDILMGDESERNVMIDDSDRSYEDDAVGNLMNRSFSDVFGKETRNMSNHDGADGDELSFSFAAFREHTLTKKGPRTCRPSHLQKLVAKKKHISVNDDLFSLDMNSDSDDEEIHGSGLLSSLPTNRRSLQRCNTAPSSTLKALGRQRLPDHKAAGI